jgi:hypothetical protein
VRNGEGEGNGDSGIDRISAGLEDSFTDIGCVLFAGHNHGVQGANRLASVQYKDRKRQTEGNGAR